MFTSIPRENVSLSLDTAAVASTFCPQQIAEEKTPIRKALRFIESGYRMLLLWHGKWAGKHVPIGIANYFFLTGQSTWIARDSLRRCIKVV
jgi:hypothetical protein